MQMVARPSGCGSGTQGGSVRLGGCKIEQDTRQNMGWKQLPRILFKKG
ncbi:MAG: hypothetical protein WCL44_06560 [bacterium]